MYNIYSINKTFSRYLVYYLIALFKNKINLKNCQVIIYNLVKKDLTYNGCTYDVFYENRPLLQKYISNLKIQVEFFLNESKYNNKSPSSSLLELR